MRDEGDDQEGDARLDDDVDVEPVVLEALEHLLELAQPQHLREAEEPQHLQRLDVRARLLVPGAVGAQVVRNAVEEEPEVADRQDAEDVDREPALEVVRRDLLRADHPLAGQVVVVGDAEIDGDV